MIQEDERVRRYFKRDRFIPILGIVLGVFGLVVADGVSVAQDWHNTPSRDYILTSLWYASSVLITLLFFGVGYLVWNYAENRYVASLLYAFCCCMMISFAVISGVDAGNEVLNALANSAVAAGIAILITLLYYFPIPLISLNKPVMTPGWIISVFYLVLIFALSLSAVLLALYAHLFQQVVPEWWYLLTAGYYAFAAIGILVIVVIAVRKARTVRERQQVRIFLFGTLFSILPIGFMTVVPTLLHLKNILAGEVSILFLVFFPLTLGYALLRYQIMILDTYIRSVVEWIAGFISLAILSYLFFVGGSYIPEAFTPFYVISSTIIWPILALFILKQTRMIAEKLFFSEIIHYRKMVNALPLQDSVDLMNVSTALITAVSESIGSPTALLFVLDEEDLQYQLFPQILKQNMPQTAQNLLGLLARVFAFQITTTGFKLDRDQTLLLNLQNAQKAITLNALETLQLERPSLSIRRYLVRNAPVGQNPLLVPILVQGKMIAFLVLAERGNAETKYAGPDLTGIELLLTRFIPLLQTARLTQGLESKNIELTDANQRLNVAYQQLLELDKRKDEFFTASSHELRTPLTAISGYLELILTYGDKLSIEEMLAFVDKANRAGEEMKEQLENIYAITQLPEEIKRIQLSKVSLQTVIDEVIEEIEMSYIGRDRKIIVSVPEEIRVLASSRHLKVIILHLIRNALKYSLPETEIEVSVQSKATTVQVTVHDQGKGIPPQFQRTIFDRFVRLERDLNSPVRGAGLGLAICKQLVEAMKGKIWVESSGNEGEGSSFCFTLRYAKEQDQQDKSSSSPISIGQGA